ncbi:glycosyl hydrolase [Chryseobacterium sp. SNU WT5]|uniref:WD40/YVTN/BNR-like repeat-containing protein n=1 Tax=Chryseobacterium sp. SNU WT5 TaxID=2594269 RepID=UPI00117CA0AB|nr:glycosyl hydrolase [Chryseobacterium sp. SNU WT5]QDP86203.1 glycosyl hydrolase [Chryseobacterium sp. SNU WT5]
MNKILLVLFSAMSLGVFAQNVSFSTLLKDDISIRALQINDGKVWYTGTDSKFGYVNINDSTEKKQLILSDKKFQFRTLAQTRTAFYTVNIESPAYFFKINKKDLSSRIIAADTVKTAFFDAFIFDQKNRGLAVSDPYKDGKAHFKLFFNSKVPVHSYPSYLPGEAHFAASNSNIAMKGNNIWIASGGTHARIFKNNLKKPNIWNVYKTPFIQGTSSQGIYSIDFYNDQFGIAVGGDYTKQEENINNIATTNDGGKTWEIQASGTNGGYKTCVKIRPKSKGKDIVAVGDQNIEFSSDYGKTWKIISEEKGLYVCEWVDANTLVFAGKNRIIKMKLNEQ